MANTITQGTDLMIFIKGGTAQAPTYTPIACATNHSLSISAETSDTSHKDIVGYWKSSSIKTLSWELSTENLFSVDATGGKAYVDLFDAMTSRTELEVVFGLKSASDTTLPWELATASADAPQYKGKVVITSLQLNAPNGDNASYTATFTGVGELSKVAS